MMDVFQENDLILKILEVVRKRPGMFINPVSLESLTNFISGYRSNYLFDSSHRDLFTNTQPSFDDWIAMKEGVRNCPSIGWVEAIKSDVGSEEDRIARFFHHLDSYLVRNASIVQEIKISENAQEVYVNQAFHDKSNKPVKAKIVSYDRDVNGVFIQFFDSQDKQIDVERYCLSFESAIEYLNSLEE